jgi:internalin A
VLKGVTAGSGLKVVILCEDAEGNVKARGEASDITVVAGQTTYISHIKVTSVAGDYNDDNDNDGYTEEQDDCDDNNSAVYPGAIEICGNAIDEDCNGSDQACDVFDVTFSDSNLESAIRAAIGIPSENIRSTDLAGLTQLAVINSRILSLEGIQYCTNLEVLDLRGDSIVDISLLSNLVHLTDLKVNYNSIKDISPLSNLVNLTDLSIDHNSISDISPLSKLVYLSKLAVGNNPIQDFSPLSNLVNLTILYSSNCDMEDISPLSNLSKLKGLFISRNKFVDISPLSNLSNLETLWFYDNQVENIGPLSNLHHIEELRCDDNLIEDISPLLENSELAGEGDTIDLRLNPLSTDSCNVHIPQLESRGVNIEHSCD